MSSLSPPLVLRAGETVGMHVHTATEDRYLRFPMFGKAQGTVDASDGALKLVVGRVTDSAAPFSGELKGDNVPAGALVYRTPPPQPSQLNPD